MTSAARALALAAALLWIAFAPSSAAAAAVTAVTAMSAKIVLIGGAPSEGPGRHAHPDGIRRLASLLNASPDVQAVAGLSVQAWPDGWPDDPHAFDGAATIVWYFDGDARHPLRDAARRAQFAALMRRGVGLVALHQASTRAPGDDAIELPHWLGAVREGLFDRTTESATLTPSNDHPIGRGVGAFTYRDEFYPSLRFQPRATPVLRSTLHVQYRAGAPVVDDIAEPSTVAWAYEREGGGRSFGYTGAHFLAALDQAALRRTLLNAIFWTAGLDVPAGGVRSDMPAVDTAQPTQQPRPGPLDASTFHRNAQRSGWNPHESVLTPANVSGPSFGRLWDSLPFDAVDGQPPRLYASPLYVDQVTLSAGQHAGATFAVVLAASSNGFVYAVNAFAAGDVAPGRILWRTRLAPPCRLQPAPLDGVPTGVLSTPVIDVARQRVYVTACDPAQRWQAYALDLTSGAVLPGWPVRLDEPTLVALNRNPGPPVAPTRRFDFRVQRGALNLSPDGGLLYVTFGETETGWLVAVDTLRAKVASAFAAAAMPHRGSGGIWGAGGPAVDAQGNVFVATGSGFNGYIARANDWTQSVLELSANEPQGFVLRGTYTPFNHCASAGADIDLGSGGVALLPDLDAAATSTPQLLALGGKQGNVYLLDRARLPGRLDTRPSCGGGAASDASLLAPEAQPQFGTRGPLNVFGPYSESDAALDAARSRSVPAFFRDARGTGWLYATGTSRPREGGAASVAPSLARLQVVTTPGQPAHLRVDKREPTLVFQNPGSPVVTSNGAHDAIVWVLDPNARRSAPLVGPDAPRPVLYAVDATTLAPLWRSAPGELFTSGKYNEPAFARGMVFVGTDRIQAFGLGRPLPPPVAVRAAETHQPLDMPRDPGAAPADGAALYAQRCAACHDHPQGSIPPRAWLATLPRSRIAETLSAGAMRVQAAGLSADEIEAVALFVSKQ
jgi:mono/diheme cytochrome c family protein